MKLKQIFSKERISFDENTSICFCKSVRKSKGRLTFSTKKSMSKNCPRKDQSGIKEMSLRQTYDLIKDEGEASHLIRKLPYSVSNSQTARAGLLMSLLLVNFSPLRQKKRSNAVLTTLPTRSERNPQSSANFLVALVCTGLTGKESSIPRAQDNLTQASSLAPAPHLHTVPSDLCLKWVTMLPVNIHPKSRSLKSSLGFLSQIIFYGCCIPLSKEIFVSFSAENKR